LPANIRSASLEILLRPNGSGTESENDTLQLLFSINGQREPHRWSRYFGAGQDSEGLLPGTWKSTSYDMHLFTLDLGNLPLSAALDPASSNLLESMSEYGFLDLIIEDDTALDYARLTYQVPSPGTAALLFLVWPALAGFSRYRRTAVTA